MIGKMDQAINNELIHYIYKEKQVLSNMYYMNMNVMIITNKHVI